jgi:hypothetical protein
MSEEKTIPPPLCGISRESKHIVLHNSLIGLQEVKEHAINLLNEIRGTSEPEVPVHDNCKSPQPSLLDVLDESPNTIGNQCSEIHEILNDIRALIF